MDINAIDLYFKKLENGIKEKHHTIDDADMADYLKKTKHRDVKKFFAHLDLLPIKLKAETLIELPVPFQADFVLKHDATQLAQVIEVMDSDDAVDFYQTIHKADSEKGDALFLLLSDKMQETIEKLMHYESSEAGSLMQTEIFQISSEKSVADAIASLSILKRKGIGSVQNLFVTDEAGRFLNTIGLDDLILEKYDAILSDIIKNTPTSYSVDTHESIDTVLETIEKYDITSLGVVDKKGYLVGRITHDDAVDAMQKRATQQIYNLNKIHKNEDVHESFGKTTKARSVWLTVNLVNAILASMVINIFETTLSAIVALAVLMPIVANMAGTASVQTMTVMVRQMALGQISFHALRPIFTKELYIAAINGLWFAVLSTAITQIWFENIYVSISIGLSMFVSFIFAGILGTSIPILLKRAGFDPAVSSSVIVITLVDIIGFFTFLWFAKMIAL